MEYQLGILQQVSVFMESITDVHKLLQQVMQVSMEAVSAQASTVFLYNPDSDELSFDVALGEKGERLSQSRVGMGEGIVGCAAKSLEIINITNAPEDERFDKTWDRQTGFKTQSILAVPMTRRGLLVGVLEVINKIDREGFDVQDQELICTIASQAAIAIENAKLYQAVLDKNQRLEQTLLQLKETQNKLLQAEKMSTIGNMASQIMHDIKNPMSIIRMCCEIIGNPEMHNTDVSTMIKLIIAQVDRSVNMIRDLLDFARGETHLNLRPQPVEKLTDGLVNVQKRDCEEKGIILKANLLYTGQLTMDLDKMHRVLDNLINNAKEALLETGVNGSKNIIFNVSSRAGFVDFSIADNGPGVPLDIRPQLFEPFVTSGKKDGTGLGLAIVDKIVRDHGGKITYESKDEMMSLGDATGTIFVVSVPLKPEDIGI